MEQLRDSYLTPVKEETTGDCVVPEGGGGKGHVMPAVSEAKQKDTPTQVITSDGEVQSEPKSQQPSPEPEFITTRVRPDSRTLFTTSELYFILRFIILCLFCKFTC